MRILGIGTDIVEIRRIKKAIEETEKFKNTVYSNEEIKYSEKNRNPYPTYSGKFAAKEAVAKAMGTGVRGFSIGDIEILNDKLGKPYAILKNKAKEMFSNLCYEFIGENDKIPQNINILDNIEIILTISHSREYATATAIIVQKESLK